MYLKYYMFIEVLITKLYVYMYNCTCLAKSNSKGNLMRYRPDIVSV